MPVPGLNTNTCCSHTLTKNTNAMHKILAQPQSRQIPSLTSAAEGSAGATATADAFTRL
jgi:hypothetical protein